jgi:acyl carrier protein phosphodiesterase
MNFLAHLYLSGNDPNVMVGNFIGDFVKGRHLHERFTPAVVKGIQLHRSIDAFTDSHPVVAQSKNRLRPKYRHYSPVIVDIFYDHYLAKNWNDYNPMLLPDFAEHCYSTLEQHRAMLPDEVLQMLPYMIRGNWLVGYAQQEGIHRALTGMSRRTRFDSKMDEAINDLRMGYDEFGEEFVRFFPELEAHCREVLGIGDWGLGIKA